MGDADQAKRARTAKQNLLKKRVSALDALITKKASLEGLEEAYQEAREARNAFEEAHEAYVVLVDKDTVKNEGDILLLPLQTYDEARTKFFKLREEMKDAASKSAVQDAFKQQADKVKAEKKAAEDAEKESKKDKFAEQQAALNAQCLLFKGLCERMSGLQTTIAPQDFRVEVEKVTAERNRLKTLWS